MLNCILLFIFIYSTAKHNIQLTLTSLRQIIQLYYDFITTCLFNVFINNSDGGWCLCHYEGTAVFRCCPVFPSLQSDSRGRPVACVMSVFWDNRLWANPRSVPSLSEHQMTRYTRLPMPRLTHNRWMLSFYSQIRTLVEDQRYKGQIWCVME